MRITLDHENQIITINNISIPASISGEEGKRIAIFEPNKEFWAFWKEHKDQVKQIAPSEEYTKVWGDDRGVMKKLGEITIWRNCKEDVITKEKTYSFRGYYDELKLFEEHEEKWKEWKQRNLTHVKPIKKLDS